MKLTQFPDENRLRISYWGRSLGVGCLGLGIWLATGGVVYLATEQETLRCYRVEPTQVSCEWFSGNIFFQRRQVETISHLAKAALETNETVDGSEHRMTLYSPSGEAKIFTLFNNNQQKVEAQVKAINQFLPDTSQSELIFTNRPYSQIGIWFVLIVWGVMGSLLVGLAIIGPVIIELRFDSQTEEVRLKRQSLLKKNEYCFTTDQIHQIAIEPPTQKEETVYLIKFTLKSQEKIWLGFGTSSFDKATHLVSTLEKLFGYTLPD